MVTVFGCAVVHKLIIDVDASEPVVTDGDGEDFSVDRYVGLLGGHQEVAAGEVDPVVGRCREEAACH
ncbi:hypothetical protein ACTQ2R_01520 [Hallella faecis]|uniref:hypothetical protein n=1 Tax=Hallella faecis TaxID=2841596 RepID=UPI003F8FCBE8